MVGKVVGGTCMRKYEDREGGMSGGLGWCEEYMRIYEFTYPKLGRYFG